MRRALLLLAAASCTTPAVAQAGAPRAVLSVEGRLDVAAGPYVEGSISYLRVLRRGRVVFERARRGPLRVRVRLRPGRVRVTSFQRPCDGSCSVLDPPTDRCSRHVRLFALQPTSVSVVTRPRRGCRMRVAAPAAFPARTEVARVRRFIRGRARSSFALVDTHGRLHGFAARRRYVSASVSKALLLVAQLRSIGNRLPSPAERAALGPMITRSDNDRASAVYRLVGDARLLELGRRAGMRDLAVAGHWSGVSFSAADLASFFYRFDSLVPARSRAYARRLLSSIVPRQRWGFPRFSLRAGWSTFFKGGWRRTGAGRLVHEGALFERDGVRFSLAVLSDANPSHRYGTATLRGVAARLFGAPRGGANHP